MAIEVGKAAPAFELRDADDREVSLSDFAGKDVVLYFYPKDDTPGCTKEACGFRDAWKELQKLGVVVLGVSPDSAASHQKFRAKYKLPFPLLSDPDEKTMKKYGAFGEKVLYGKKTLGVIRSTRVDRPRRQGAPPLGARRQGGGPSRAGARGAARGQVAPSRRRRAAPPRQLGPPPPRTGGCGGMRRERNHQTPSMSTKGRQSITRRPYLDWPRVRGRWPTSASTTR